MPIAKKTHPSPLVGVDIPGEAVRRMSLAIPTEAPLITTTPPFFLPPPPPMTSVHFFLATRRYFEALAVGLPSPESSFSPPPPSIFLSRKQLEFSRAASSFFFRSTLFLNLAVGGSTLGKAESEAFQYGSSPSHPLRLWKQGGIRLGLYVNFTLAGSCVLCRSGHGSAFSR